MDTEAVWADFGNTLHNYIARKVPDPGDVEDLLQETFLRVHHHGIPEGRNPAPWLFTVVRNLITDYRRKHSSRPVPLEVEQPDYDRFEVRESEQIAAGWLHGFAAAIPPKYGEAVRLADLEGKSMQEVADALGLSVSGAKSRVQRGRKLLAKELMECCTFQMDHQGRVQSWQRNDCPGCTIPDNGKSNRV
ncbi:MAG: sigma-70 family RNA polymerase sigma factor [Acidobacteriota bacterium]|nr:sigma-70 family RNA polymerase sigma factor [Acidobacteriota bacterium]